VRLSPTRKRISRISALAAALALAAGLVAGCGSDDTTDGGVEIVSAWGTAQVPVDPQRVAVVSTGDRDMALQLGVKPVIAYRYGDNPNTEYQIASAKKAGFDLASVPTFDGTDGADYTAIAAAEPDVILATNSWSNDDEFDKLSKIAPVVAVEKKEQQDTMPWADRLRLVAKALGRSDKAEEFIKNADTEAAKVRAAHPQLEGKTFAYMIIHPEQITYGSSSDSDMGPIEALGMVKAPAAAKFTMSQDKVSIENLSVFDADILFVAYPFGDEGVITQKDLESNPLFQSIPAVKAGRYTVLDSDSGLASEIAYSGSASFNWVVERVASAASGVVNGKGGQ
jgi:iron complex transport system substrate-binding protein